MTTRKLQDLLNDVITWRTDIVTTSEIKFQDIVTMIETTNSKFQAECSNLRSHFLTITYSKLQTATENITAKIQQANEKLSDNLTQILHNEVKKMSSGICTLQNDTENKFQEVTRAIEGVNGAMNERIDAHVVATRRVTDRIFQEMNVRSAHLLDDIKEYRTETENSLKEFRQDFSQFREQLNSEQATWQNKTGVEMDKVNDSVRLIEEMLPRLVEDWVTEVQAAAQNNI